MHLPDVKVFLYLENKREEGKDQTADVDEGFRWVSFIINPDFTLICRDGNTFFRIFFGIKEVPKKYYKSFRIDWLNYFYTTQNEFLPRLNRF